LDAAWRVERFAQIVHDPICPPMLRSGLQGDSKPEDTIQLIRRCPGSLYWGAPGPLLSPGSAGACVTSRRMHVPRRSQSSARAGWPPYHVAGFRSAGAEVVAIADKSAAAAKAARRRNTASTRLSASRRSSSRPSKISTARLHHHPERVPSSPSSSEALAAGKARVLREAPGP